MKMYLLIHNDSPESKAFSKKKAKTKKYVISFQNVFIINSLYIIVVCKKNICKQNIIS